MQIQWKIPPACWPAFQAGSARNSSLSTVPHKYTIYINEYLIKAQRCTERTAGQVNSNRVHLPPLNCDIPEVAIVLYRFDLQKAPDINCVVGGAQAPLTHSLTSFMRWSIVSRYVPEASCESLTHLYKYIHTCTYVSMYVGLRAANFCLHTDIISLDKRISASAVRISDWSEMKAVNKLKRRYPQTQNTLSSLSTYQCGIKSTHTHKMQSSRENMPTWRQKCEIIVFDQFFKICFFFF